MPYLTAHVTANWTDHLRAFADAGPTRSRSVCRSPIRRSTASPSRRPPRRHWPAARPRTASSPSSPAVRAGLPPLVVSTYSNLALRDGPDRFGAALARRGRHRPDRARPAARRGRRAGSRHRGRGHRPGPPRLAGDPDRPTGRDRAAQPRLRLRGVGDGHDRGTDRAGRFGGGTRRPDPGRHRPAGAAGLRRVDSRARGRAARSADGVIVGAAVLRRILDGASPAEVAAYLATMRRALDREEDGPP